MLRENLEAENDGRLAMEATTTCRRCSTACFFGHLLQLLALLGLVHCLLEALELPIDSSTNPVPQRTRTRPIHPERSPIGQREGVHLFIPLGMSLAAHIDTQDFDVSV